MPSVFSSRNKIVPPTESDRNRKLPTQPGSFGASNCAQWGTPGVPGSDATPSVVFALRFSAVQGRVLTDCSDDSRPGTGEWSHCDCRWQFSVRLVLLIPGQVRNFEIWKSPLVTSSVCGACKPHWIKPARIVSSVTDPDGLRLRPERLDRLHRDQHDGRRVRSHLLHPVRGGALW